MRPTSRIVISTLFWCTHDNWIELPLTRSAHSFTHISEGSAGIDRIIYPMWRKVKNLKKRLCQPSLQVSRVKLILSAFKFSAAEHYLNSNSKTKTHIFSSPFFEDGRGFSTSYFNIGLCNVFRLNTQKSNFAEGNGAANARFFPTKHISQSVPWYRKLAFFLAQFTLFCPKIFSITRVTSACDSRITWSKQRDFEKLKKLCLHF